MVHSVAH